MAAYVSWLHSADKDAVYWLTNYDTHTRQKRKCRSRLRNYLLYAELYINPLTLI